MRPAGAGNWPDACNNDSVPFTPAHAAAVLPFSRTRLVLSALVMGSFAPDFEYFLRFTAHGGFGHTLPGMFLFSLPAALTALWLFHRWIKPVAALMAPRPLRERLTPYLGPFSFGPGRRFVWVAASALVGVATHIAWDSFTHPTSPLVRHWALLRSMVVLPVIGEYPVCRLLQQTSTLLGLAALALCIFAWARRAAPVPMPEPHGAVWKRVALWIALPGVATAAALARVALVASVADDELPFKPLLSAAVVTWIAVFWWELVVVGYFADSAGELNRHSQAVNAALTAAPDTDQ